MERDLSSKDYVTFALGSDTSCSSVTGRKREDECNGPLKPDTSYK